MRVLIKKFSHNALVSMNKPGRRTQVAGQVRRETGLRYERYGLTLITAKKPLDMTPPSTLNATLSAKDDALL